MTSAFQTVDMTVGTPWKQILKFTWPVLLGNIIQQLYSTVDSIVVGRYVGDNALAAVGTAAPITNLMLALFIGVGMGATILVSQYLGARNRAGLSWTVGNCMLLILIAAAIMTTAGILAARPILELLRTPESILDWSAGYLTILFAGSVGLGMFNILSGVLRGLGDSVSALIYLAVASVLNIILDVLFVTRLHLAVNGVAYATILAQGVSALLCINRLRKMRELFDFGLPFCRWRRQYAGTIIRLGLPSGIQQAIISLSLVVVQSLINSFGEAVIAANVMLQRVDGFAMQPNATFGIAMTAYAGQNVGAGDEARLRRGARQGMLIAVVTSAAITSAMILLAEPLMGIFTETRLLVELGVRFIRIMAVGYLGLAFIQTTSGVMRGAGDTVTPMWLGILTMLLRVALAYLMVGLSRSAENPIGRPELLYWSLLASWLLGTGMNALCYRFGPWRKKAAARARELREAV